MLRNRVLAAGIIGVAAMSAVAASEGTAQESTAQEGARAITCTNPVSGASWQIHVDYGKATVDANPAKITRAAISWFDPTDGSNNTLDRQTGALTASAASSTGGYVRYARCGVDKSR